MLRMRAAVGPTACARAMQQSTDECQQRTVSLDSDLQTLVVFAF